MDVDSLNNLYNESGYRIRCLRSLAWQVKNDFSDLIELMRTLKTDSSNFFEIEQIFQKISWVKQGLKAFEKLKMMEIEGVIWQELENIEKDMKHIEMQFNTGAFSLVTKHYLFR